MRKLLIFILFIITIINAYTSDEENWRMAGKKTIYENSDEGLSIDANSRWVKIDNMESPFFKDFPLPPEGYTRKWRIYSRYSDSDSSIKTSFQIKFMTNSFKRPTFSFVRPLGYAGELDGFSDWFQFEDGKGKRTYKGDASVYARVISPPTADNRGTLYSVELQAWDVLNEVEDTKTAAGRALPGTDIFNKNREYIVEKSREQATDFAMQVMETIFNRDREEFYELLSDKCYSLEYGTVYFKDNLPLYDDLKGITNGSYITMASYKKNYKPQLITYEEYSDLFPHWVAENREWRPGKNDYLFYGNISINRGDKLLNPRMAVFMISFNGNRWEIKAIPQ